MYRVLWLQEALNELARIWLESDSAQRSVITMAVDTLDQQLQTDPFWDSESRSGDLRIVFAYPLGVEITIDEKQRVVWVAHVWRFWRRGPER